MANTVRNRANVSSNRTPSSSSGTSLSQEDASIPHTPNSSRASNPKKNVRGCTRGIALRKLNKKNNEKLVIHIDPEQGRPVDSVESAKLSSELGQIARESLRVPIKWKDLDREDFMPAFHQLDREMEKRRVDAETTANDVDIEEIVDGVLGKRSSYIVGLGYGPKPKKASSSSSMRMRLKEKEKECDELKEKMGTMEETLAEHTRFLEKLLQSQQNPSNSTQW
ncbi:hypothetical protein BUALT_Bualt04G0062800 [Buddleja alternifolia]|uniref:Uncharacterized protein n=1 Tax=Buddleja alternifolia TaxID=168488 RepID=A0AAV6XLQ7_9LAMI|nr:hypothetical protein BUALT_Bualt04G0062800 [Buddleja alternifolia]